MFRMDILFWNSLKKKMNGVANENDYVQETHRVSIYGHMYTCDH